MEKKLYELKIIDSATGKEIVNEQIDYIMATVSIPDKDFVTEIGMSNTDYGTIKKALKVNRILVKRIKRAMKKQLHNLRKAKKYTKQDVEMLERLAKQMVETEAENKEVTDEICGEE